MQPTQTVSQSRERELTQMSAGQIAALVARGEAAAIEVVEAHIARIEAVDPILNAVVVRRFEEARREAADVDARRDRGEPLGPLGGVPITIKECLDVAGTASSLAVAALAEVTAKRDGPLVARLRAAGAVILGKTNLPQLAMALETDSSHFGRACNPWDPDRSPGGSSGGEAAIIAAGGSPMGLATDAGGSIRYPAHCCGIQGFKPTAGRLTQSDLPVTRTDAGDTQIPVNMAGFQSFLQPGPMARHVDDLCLAMQVLAAPGLERIDPTVPPIPWRDPTEVELHELSIGYYEDDGTMPVAPALSRVVREAIAALESCGVRVVRFAPGNVAEAMQIFQRLIIPDGGAAFQTMMRRSATDAATRELLFAAKLPRPVRRLTAAALRRAGQGRLADTVECMARLSAHEYRQQIEARSRYTAEFLAAMHEAEIDAIVCPPHVACAPPHGTGSDLALAASYTSLYNLTGMPAGVVAAGRVRDDESAARDAGRCRVERTASRIERGSAGLPVGVQVAGLPWRDDVVLAVMRALESHFRQQSEYPERPPSLAARAGAKSP